MKLNKPIFTIILIILLVIDLIFFSIVIIGKKVLDKDNIKDIAYSFNYKEYLKDNKNIKESISKYNYSFEVFDYIDDNEVKRIEDKFIDNLYSNKKAIEYEDVLLILNNSIDKYEKNNLVDIHSYVDDDINEVAGDISNIDEEFSLAFNYVNRFVNSNLIYLFLLIAIISIALIIVFEHINGCLINSIILILYSIFLYYSEYNVYSMIRLDSDTSKYFMDLSNKIVNLDNMYVISFLLGFVFLLIYVVKLIRRIVRDIRLNSYYFGR